MIFWITFVDEVQKSLVGQNVTTGPSIYKYVERVPKGDAKVEFLQKANLVGSHTVANLTMIMATMTMHIFPNYTCCDQKRNLQRNLRNPFEVKALVFTARIIQLNT